MASRKKRARRRAGDIARPSAAKPRATRVTHRGVPAWAALALLPRGFWLGAGLLAATAVAVAVLAYAVLGHIAERDWAEVVRVDDMTVNRAELRERVRLAEFLFDARRSTLRDQVRQGRLDPQTHKRLEAALENQANDPVAYTIDELVDEALLERFATSAAGFAPASDIAGELGRYVGGGPTVHVEWLTIERGPRMAANGRPPTQGSPPANTPAATTRAAAEWALGQLGGDAAFADLAAALKQRGWSASDENRWIPIDHPPPQLDASLLAGARASEPGTVLGPFVDPWLRATVGRVLKRSDDRTNGTALADELSAAGVADEFVRDWTAGRARRRALEERLLHEVVSAPSDQARAQLLVVGTTDNSGAEGPWIQLSHVFLGELEGSEALPFATPAATPSGLSSGEQIGFSLRALPLVERRRAWRALVDRANRAGPPSERQSGELGFFTADQLTPALAKPAFAPETQSGSILGPVQTSAGEELFMVESRYDGALDERSVGALIDARRAVETGTSLVALAARLAPEAVDVARGDAWRAVAEFGRDDPTRAALFETPLYELSDPFAIEGRIVVARAVERRKAPLQPDQMDRIRLTIVPNWLAEQRNAAEITIVPNPLPEERAADETPSATIPSLPGRQAPRLPTILPAPTP